MRPIQQQQKTPLRKKTAPPTRPKPPKTPKTPQINGKDKEPVAVYCRLRPPRNLVDLVCVHRVLNNNTIVRVSAPVNGGGQPHTDRFYKFKHVFGEQSKQKQIFDDIALPLATDLLNGKNGLLFTYGITSSGKTFTIAGTPSEPGILPRTLDVLFNTLLHNQIQSRKYVFKPDGSNHFEIQSTPDAILQAQREQRDKGFRVPSTPGNGISSRTPRSARKRENREDDWEQRVKDPTILDDINSDNHYAIFVSYVEIYNNYIYDLLDENVDFLKNSRQPQSKVLREDSRRRVFVHLSTEVEVKTADEAFELFIKGVRRRSQANTNLNAESSRSHSVFTIRVIQAPIDANGAEVIQDDRFLTSSQLSIVDLAGSERTNRTKNTGDRLREAGGINKSLMALRNCIDILRENQLNGTNKVVPYRDYKITHLFKSYLEGEGCVRMIICVNPSAEDYDETLHVMKFAEHSQDVYVSKGVNRFNYLQTMPKLFEPMLSVDLAAINVVGPDFPTTFLEDPEDDKVFPEWLECLEQRKLNKEMKFEAHKQNQLIVRQRVAEMEKENMYLKQQLSALQMDLAVREGQIKDYENRFAQNERHGDGYHKKISEMERTIRSLQTNYEEKCRQLSQSDLEKERMKTKMRERLDSEREYLKNAFERLLVEKQSQLEREQCVAKDKMNLVKQILNADTTADDIYRDLIHQYMPSHSALRPSCGPNVPSSGGGVDSQASTQTPQQSAYKRKSEFDLATNSTPQTVSSGADHNVVSPHNPPPVCNPRHRRSLSTGNEKWVDHRPPGTLELGTVLRPKIKNKKSVSNLKASHIKDASKYALTHHEADINGQVETQVFKGEVIPSSTGGSQVIFNDVETLKQGSPPIRKRTQSDTRLLSPNMADNHNVITSAEIHNQQPVNPFTKRSRR